ncbi:MAG: hypothetical protein ACR2PG_15650 [Hyphomicrobiaceae bacterium]
MKPDFDPFQLAYLSLLNPVVIAVACYLGLGCDQWQKVFVAGFASAFVAAVAIWLVTAVGLLPPRSYGSDSGLFVLNFLYGSCIAAVCRSVRPIDRR